jgi:hypothetical protein
MHFTGGNFMSKKLIVSFIFAIVAVLFSVLTVTADEPVWRDAEGRTWRDARNAEGSTWLDEEGRMWRDAEGRTWRASDGVRTEMAFLVCSGEPPEDIEYCFEAAVEFSRQMRLTRYKGYGPEVADVMMDVLRRSDELSAQRFQDFLGDREAEDLTAACWSRFSFSFSTQAVTECGITVNFSTQTHFTGFSPCGNGSPSFSTTEVMTRGMTRVPAVSEPVIVDVPEISEPCFDDCVSEMLEPNSIALSSSHPHPVHEEMISCVTNTPMIAHQPVKYEKLRNS